MQGYCALRLIIIAGVFNKANPGFVHLDRYPISDHELDDIVVDGLDGAVDSTDGNYFITSLDLGKHLLALSLLHLLGANYQKPHEGYDQN